MRGVVVLVMTVIGVYNDGGSGCDCGDSGGGCNVNKKWGVS